MDEFFAQLGSQFQTETHFDRLGKMRERILAHTAESDLPLKAGMLHAAIIRRMNDWHAAAQALEKVWLRFPNDFEAAYEYALNAIDGSLYEDARRPLLFLISHRTEIPDRYLRGIWLAAAIAGYHDLSSLAVDEAVSRGSELASPGIIYRDQIVSQNQQKNYPPIISLGENCLPWMLVNRWGFRRNAFNPEHQSLFNLAQTTIAGSAAIIRDRGENLVNAQKLQIAQAVGTPRMPYNAPFQYSFNHEMGATWIDNDFAGLLDRYRPRIANFRRALSGGERIFFFYTCSSGNINDVIDALYVANEDEKYKLIIVDTWNDERPEQARVDQRVIYVRLQLPRPDYIWFRPADFESPEGIHFEQTIHDIIVKTVG
jgi:hypothetical protein